MYDGAIASQKRGYATKSYCQGLCDELKNNPGVGGKKYKDHAFCKRCDYWMLKTILKPHPTKGVVCPCCNFRPRMKSWK